MGVKKCCERCERYICFTVAWINGDGWTFADTGNGHTENLPFEDVKFWMSLPEPPESEVQNV